MDALRVPAVVHLAACWKVTRQDGVALRLTDADAPIVLASGETYEPTGSAEASARRKEGELESQSVEILGVMSSDKITAEDLRRGKYRDALVEYFLVDRRYPWQGHFHRQRFWMRAPTFDSESWSAELEGFGGRLEREVGLVAARHCRHELGDGFGTPKLGCTVDLALHTVSNKPVVWVDSTLNRVKFRIDYDSPNSDGHFALGKVVWLTGNNAGSVSRVRTDSKQDTDKCQLELFLEADYDIEVGDTCDLILGCNKLAGVGTNDTTGHCKNRFGINGGIRPEFGGDPYIPGTAKILRRPL
jgi:uncharacterized phage protein (TIGR02218 family)